MKSKEKLLSLKTQFKEAVDYLKESKDFIIISLILFFLSAIVGFLFSEQLRFIDSLLLELLEKTSGLNWFEMIFFILQNNLQSAFMALISGVIFGIPTLTVNIINGLVMGYVLARTFEVAGVVSWWRLLPHGIFELPAIFISFALGIKLGFSIFLNKKHRAKEFKRRFYNAINVFLMIIIPLLIVAAIIEGLLISFLS